MRAATVLILRPSPGAEATAARARAAGLTPLVHPLFRLVPRSWSLPTTSATALLLTSANAVRMAGALPDALSRLPVFAVGAATAAGARNAGLTLAWTGDSDASAAVRALAEAGHGAVWHLRGRDTRTRPAAGVRLAPIIAYEAQAIDAPRPNWPGGAVALLHSPRAATRLAELTATDDRRHLALVAISAATARAAGEGWAGVKVAKRPTDAALLAGAADLARLGGRARHR